MGQTHDSTATSSQYPSSRRPIMPDIAWADNPTRIGESAGKCEATKVLYRDSDHGSVKESDP